MSEKYYKFLTARGTGGHTEFVWPVGEWVEAEGPLELCRNGLHVLTRDQAVSWIEEKLYEVEIAVEGEVLRGEDKLCVRRARLVKKLKNWNPRTQRLFACDCAERVLPLFEKEYPNDDRPRLAIQTAREYAEGRATRSELAEAWKAAGAARKAAREARVATREAARATWAAASEAWEAARVTAWVAAREAAGAAARVAGEATRGAERQWQTKRFWQYVDGKI